MMWYINSILFLFISMSFYFCVSGNDQFECFECNNVAHGDACLSTPTKMNRCNSTQNQCYVFMDDDFARRGCIGDDFFGDLESCKKKPGVCKTCSGDELCNIDELSVEKCIFHAEYKGVPTLFDPVSRSCPISLRPSGCYHMDDRIHNKVRKGCVNELSDEDKKVCRSNGSDCKICRGGNCNHRDAFVKCLNCDSATNPKCISPDDSIETTECKYYDDKCFTYTKNNTVTRGCLNEATEAIKQSCTVSGSKCRLCSSIDGKQCNDKSLDDTCIACDSITDPDCVDSPQSFGELICTVKDQILTKGCYLQKFGDFVTRGCVEDLSPEDISMCRKQGDFCQTCMNKNCNMKKDFRQKCLSCNSKDEILCANGNGGTLINCGEYSSSCLVGIDASDITHRGCSSPLFMKDEIAYGERFETCYEADYCNNHVYPENRQLCYQCNDCDTVSNKRSQSCQTYKEDDSCFAFMDKDGKIHRGCISDETKERDLCGASDEKCKECTASSCNDFNKDQIYKSGVNLSAKISFLTLIVPFIWIGSKF